VLIPILSYSLNGVTPKFSFVFLQWAILIDTSSKKKLGRLPKNSNFYVRMECLPLWRTCIGDKVENFGQKTWDRVSCYWEHPRGTHWELEEKHG
jgi:hypothetical protein